MQSYAILCNKLTAVT